MINYFLNTIFKLPTCAALALTLTACIAGGSESGNADASLSIFTAPCMTLFDAGWSKNLEEKEVLSMPASNWRTQTASSNDRAADEQYFHLADESPDFDPQELFSKMFPNHEYFQVNGKFSENSNGRVADLDDPSRILQKINASDLQEREAKWTMTYLPSLNVLTPARISIDPAKASMDPKYAERG